MEDYYKMLGVKNDATYDEIKRRYHDLVKKIHPDRSDSSDGYTFQDIDEAWKILRDPIKRKEYDEAYRQYLLEAKDLLFGTFKLEDLEFDADTEHYSYDCRCGGIYRFHREGSEEFNAYLVSCDQCSLVISVEVK